MNRLSSLTAFFALATALSAQLPAVLPAGNDLVFGGNNGTGVGYAANNGISQDLYIAPLSAPAPISAVGFRRTATTTTYASVSIDFELGLSSTVADLTTLSSTFASNLGADFTVVFPRQVISIPSYGPNLSPNDFVMTPLTAPFLFGLNDPNLLVQCKSFGTTGTGVNIWRMDRCFERTTAGDAISWGASCSGASVASTGSYLPGGAFTLTLANAAPLQPAFAFLGFDLTTAIGLPLPADLGVVGMTGCTLLVSTDATLSTFTDGSGAASVGLTIPGDPNLSGVGFGMQWIYADPNAGNALGLVTTLGRMFHIGPVICANRYVYSLSNFAAATGSLQAGGPVVKLM